MSSRLRRIAFVPIAALAWQGAALAGTLPVQGTFGDAAGCRIAAGGVADTDTYAILEADELRRHESSCEILDVRTAKNGEHVARSLCGGEGEMWLDDFVVVPDREGGASLFIHGGPGAEPIEVRPCE